jgi:hypothetical protein
MRFVNASALVTFFVVECFWMRYGETTVMLVNVVSTEDSLQLVTRVKLQVLYSILRCWRVEEFKTMILPDVLYGYH